MERLASQTAAHKLGQILGLMLIPVVVLWSMYFFNAKAGIDELSREINGARLAMLLVAPKGSPLERRALEIKLGVGEAPEQLESAPLFAIAAANATYLEKVARASGLSVDGELQSNALADIGMISIPSFDRLVGHGLAQLDAGGIAIQQSAAALMLVAGEADALARRIADNISLSTLSEDKDVARTLGQYKQLVLHTGSAITLLVDPSATSLEKEVALSKLRKEFAKHRAVYAIPLQTKVLTVLEEQLKSRHAALWRNLLLLTLAGLVSTLAGVGLAVLMMRSTFIRLDDVERSTQEAHAAKREAEQLNLRFTTINADISNLNQDLALKVKELRAAQDELVKRGRMEQLGQLTATIAHEIRNPLGAIRTSAFMLQRKTASMGEDVAGQIQRINNGVNRCDSIISQLLDFSRTKEVNSSPIQLDEWLVRTVRDEAKRLPDTINIECGLGLDDLQVPFDPARLQRAIINLLNNACEAFANADGHTLPAGHRHTITVSTQKKDAFAVIRVSDNGPGIPPDIIHRIREPLFTTKSFGTGLGIPAVEQIVRQHGGHLDISSDVGNGATFTINLPIMHQQGTKHAA